MSVNTETTGMSPRLVLLSALAAVLIVFTNQWLVPALTWPAVDNLPAVCRALSASCLSSDFFANASATLNPRTPYIELVAMLTGLVNQGLGGGLAVIKSVVLFGLPAAASVFLLTALHRHMPDIAPTMQVLACVLVPLLVYLLQSDVGRWLSVAWWVPLGFDATTHNLSLLLTLVGYCLIQSFRMTAVLFVVAGTVLHPAVGLFVCAAAIVMLGRAFSFANNRALLIFGLLPGLLAALLVRLLFAGEVNLPVQDFVRIYVSEGHPAHYLPSEFGTFTQFPWYVPFTILLSLLIAASAVLYWLQCSLWRNAVLATVGYGGAVLMQYLFVELIPVKLIAALGPSRFTLFGGWFLAFFVLLIVIKVLQRFHASRILLAASNSLGQVRVSLLVALSLVILMLAVQHVGISNRIGGVDTHDRALIAFGQANAAADDVFVLPFGNIRYALPIVSRRGTFFGNGFPFTEDYFEEYSYRLSVIDGNEASLKQVPGSWIGEKNARFYNTLTAEHFLGIAENARIDWVVTRAGVAPFSQCAAAFASDKYWVFHVSTLEECSSR
jgi:hypothetical protein